MALDHLAPLYGKIAERSPNNKRRSKKDTFNKQDISAQCLLHRGKWACLQYDMIKTSLTTAVITRQ